MSINDRARKILWSNSGNRCAFYKRQLIIGATAKDDISIIKEECHVISRQINTLRHDAQFN